MNEVISKNKYNELSAIIDSDSFFYGLFEKDVLKECNNKSLNEIDMLSNSTDKQKYSLRTEAFVHIPVSEYQAIKKKQYFNNNVVYNSLMDPVIIEERINDEVLCLWAIERKRGRELKLSSNSVHYYHHSTIMIKWALAQKQNGVYINFLSQSMDVLVIKEERLFYFNNYQFDKVPDVLYYTILAFYYSDLDARTDRLILMGEVMNSDEKYKLLSTYVKDIYFIKSDTYKESVDVDQEIHHYMPLLALHQCEL